MTLTQRVWPWFLVVSLVLSASPFIGAAQTLRVVTLNFWSGVDYEGILTVGEYQSPEEREARFASLLEEVRRIRPDVLALQESNEIHRVSGRLADSLDYDVVYLRLNAGIKVGCLGMPWNLNEGLAFLARRDLQLELVDAVDLSRRFGAVGNTFSLHVDDQDYALIARVRIGGGDVYLANAHLTSAVPATPASHAVLDSLLISAGTEVDCRPDYHRQLDERSEMRRRQTENLLDGLREALGSAPVILLGDFNATPDSPEIRSVLSEGYHDVCAGFPAASRPTWEPLANPLIGCSLDTVTATGEPLDPLARLTVWYDLVPRRIDYIFVGPNATAGDIRFAAVVFRDSIDGAMASDHFGLMAEIDLSRLFARSDVPDRFSLPVPPPAIDPLAFIMYDTDVGFGYGAKVFFLNHLAWSESFDLTLFNSTKGERWYRLVFSVPDFELRQGKIYLLAFDLTVDYDKYLKNNYFGVGPAAAKDRREVYTKEPLEITAVFSRGFSSRLVAQAGLKLRIVRNFNFEPGAAFLQLPRVNIGRSQALSATASVRYDSRNSFINPSHGFVAQLDFEAAPSIGINDYTLAGGALTLQSFHTLFYPKTVLAARILAKITNGSNQPVHTYASIGGNTTLRGYPQDRFLERSGVIGNLEIRFPIIWRFGGVILWDFGRPVGTATALNPFKGGWKSNIGGGLRFYMDTFVVRADVGVSNESTGFYFNFGHAF